MAKKRIVGIGLALFGLPLLAAGALYLLVDAQKLKPVVEGKLSEALARKTSLGGLSFTLMPPSFRATELTVADDAAYSSGPFLTASAVEIRPRLLSLLTGAVEIDSMRLSEPRFELIEKGAGQWNYATIGAKKNDGASTGLSLGQLNLDMARVGVKRGESAREEYSRLSAELRDYAEGRPFHLKLAALLPSGEPVSAEGKISSVGGKTSFADTGFALGGVKGTITGEVNAGALNLRVEIPKSPVADMAPLFLPKGVSVKGELSAKVTATGTTAAPVLRGRVDVSGFEVSGGAIKQPVKTEKLGIELTPERITLEPANVSSGSTQLQAFGVVSKYASDPQLEATMIAPAAQLAELLAIARAYGISAVDGVSATGTAKLQVRAHGGLGAKGVLEFAGSGSMRDANLELKALTRPVAVRAADFRFESNAAALTGVEATIGSTNARGDLRVANFTRPAISFTLEADKVLLSELRDLFKDTGAKGDSQPAKLTAQGSLKIGTLELVDLSLTKVSTQVDYREGQARLDPLTAAVYGGQSSGSMEIDLRPNPPLCTLNTKVEKIESGQLMGATTALKGIVSGPMSGVLKLKFSPADGPQLARSLNGTVSLKFDQGKIASFNLLNELAVVAQFLGFNRPGEKFTQFLGLSGDLTIVNGAASTQNLKLDLANLTAGLTGSMNLADQTLDMKLMSILDKKFSEQVGGTKVGAFMTAAMANGAGNLMIPASIKGTFARPILAPDPGAIAKMRLQSFNPKDPKQMMDSVNSLLDMFKKKPAAQPQP